MSRSTGRPDAGTATLAAAIDIGSNSVLLLTVAVDVDGRTRVLDEALATTRLGAGLHEGGALDPGGRSRTRDAVAAFATRARAAGAACVWGFATGAVRSAADGPAFARQLEAVTGVPVEVLAGEREAQLAYAAVARGLGAGPEPLLVADVGGRTTEVTLGVGDRIDALASLPLGALALTEIHLLTDPPRAAELANAGRAIAAALGGTDVLASGRARGATLAASGGTATALAVLDLGLDTYDARRVHGHTLSGAALQALGARLAAMPARTRAALPGLDPARAAILPAGTLVIERLAAAAGAAVVRVSDHGVRHAYLAARLATAGVTADFRELVR